MCSGQVVDSIFGCYLITVLYFHLLSFHFILYVYKPVGTTKILSERRKCSDMCGDMLRLIFKYGGTFFMKVKKDHQGRVTFCTMSNTLKQVQKTEIWHTCLANF